MTPDCLLQPALQMLIKLKPPESSAWRSFESRSVMGYYPQLSSCPLSLLGVKLFPLPFEVIILLSVTGPRNLRTIINGNFIRMRSQAGKGVNILHGGPAQRREGGAGEGLCPQLEDKGRGNPNHNPVSKSRPSGERRPRVERKGATSGQRRGAAPSKWKK